jgi:N-acylneuraminate cytidylyltransferase
MSHNCWAIIPARGGSQGVKGKNIKILDGKPLLGRAIDSLKEANIFDRIVVTSDCEKILNVAEEYGAKVFLRTDPEESNNFVMNDVPVLSYLESIEKKALPKFCMMVQCTGPFVNSASYSRAMELLIQHPNSTVFAAHVAHSFLWKKKNENELDSQWLPINHPFHERVGRQFAQTEQVHETGAFYGFPTNDFISARHRFFSQAYPVLIQGDEIIDINEVEDWEYAEFIIKRRRNTNEN